MRPLEQLWPPDLAPPSLVHSLFLALRPAASIRATLDRYAEQLRLRHGLRGTRVKPEHFHVPLHGPAHDVDLCRDLIAAMHEVSANFATPAFRVTFDRILHFKRSQAVVLTESSVNVALHRFRRELGLAVIRGGLGRFVTPKFTPHITLRYDPHPMPEQNVPPLS